MLDLIIGFKMKVTFPGGCQPGSHLFLLLSALLVIIPMEMVKSDHTTLCINFPHLRYRDNSLMSLGMEKFPQSKELWSMFEEQAVAGRVGKADAAKRHRKVLAGQVGWYPNGGLYIYKITDTRSKKLLTGWYRVEFFMDATARKPDLHESLKALVISVQDDLNRRQTIGEFSLNFPTDTNQCPPNDATKYMLISCGGASRAEPLVSNVIVLVRNNSELDEPNGIKFPPESDGLEIVPNLRGKHKLNFYIRIPVQDCNQHRHFVFRAKVIIDKTVFKTESDGIKPDAEDHEFFRITSTYITINRDEGYIPGASEALPSRSHSKYLDCSDRLKKNNLPWFARQYDGVNSGDEMYAEFVQVAPYDNILYTHGCQGHYFRGRCLHNFYSMVSAFGTTTYFLSNQNVAEENQMPLCDTQRVLPSGMGIEGVNLYQQYYQKPTKYNGKDVSFPSTPDYLHKFATPCNTTYNGDPNCNVSKVVIDLKRRMLLELRGKSIHMQRRRLRLLGFNEYHPAYYRCSIDMTNKTRYSGNNCSSPEWDSVTGVGFYTEGYHRLLWAMRKGHALLMAIAFLFVLPVNLFVTRYFKESFMDKRVLYSRIWYQVHVHGTFILAGLLIAGLGIVFIGEFYLGKSLIEASRAHRILGWMTFVLFVGMIILGGFRGYQDPLRKITIWLHWGSGLFFYLLMVIEMATGVLIPGNGVASHDPSSCGYDELTRSCSEQKPAYVSGAFVHIFAWVIIEVIIHIIMMFFSFVSDKQMAVVKSRIFFPVLIPVVKEHSKLNAFGHSIRVVLLCVYVFLALCSTSMYIIAYITYTRSTDKGLGPMSATHIKNLDPNISLEFVMRETLGDY